MSFVNLSLRPVRDFRLARVFSGFGYLTPMEGFITINISVHRKVWFRFRKKSNARNHVANAKNRRNLSHSSPTCRTGLKLFRWFDFLVSFFLSLSRALHGCGSFLIAAKSAPLPLKLTHSWTHMSSQPGSGKSASIRYRYRSSPR